MSLGQRWTLLYEGHLTRFRDGKEVEREDLLVVSLFDNRLYAMYLYLTFKGLCESSEG